jgi:hypothetical protein
MQTAFTLPTQSFRLKENQGVCCLIRDFDFGGRSGSGCVLRTGFGEHLAKLSLRLRRFSREGLLPLGHEQYVGMPEAELNPACG